MAFRKGHKYNIRHGFSRSKSKTKKLFYDVWVGLKGRCLNPNNKDFRIYGERGITVSEEWKTFENFFRDMWPRPKGTFIDRIDNNKGYSRENCRWATMAESTRNRRTSLIYSYKGKSLCLKEIAALEGINYNTLYSRVRYAGFSLKEAIR